MISVEPCSKRRDLSQTYLVFPEWYIVYAANDLAKICKESCPSNFPYLRSIFQFWYAYFKVLAITRKFKFNRKYQGMLIIIGLSFSAEMILKGAYELTIGRLSWLANGRRQTKEDEFLAKISEEYGKFMYSTPWYKFDFKEWLKNLDQLPRSKDLRSKERRFIIKLELWIKMKYAALIGKGVQTPDDPKLEAVVADRLGERSVVTLPRYQAFDKAVSEFETRFPDYSYFSEIAGNKVICLSVIAWKETPFPEYAKRLYSLSLLDNRNFSRTVIELPVEKLVYFLKHSIYGFRELEKIYDY